MYYSEFHNHKWARNLAHARNLWQSGNFEALYRGEPLGDADYFPGLRVMGAYWVSVEHEMPMRLMMLLKGAQRPDLTSQPAIAAQGKAFLERYLDDMRELITREGILPVEQFEALVHKGLETPADWAEKMHGWQQASEEALAQNQFPQALFDDWLHSCLRSVANYNRFLILGGVCAAALYKEGGEAALRAAIDATSEEFMWEISKAFYNTVLPAAGFEDIGDLMELGLRGMFSDQWYVSGAEREEGEITIRESILKNCELAGIYHSVAEWNGLPKTSLGYGICRYCEAHGEATMMISMPPMVSPQYCRVVSLGMDDKACVFELKTVPADDMERILMVQERVFGAVDEE
ncbi:MAG TPA: hypothetical protein VFF78_07660 [Anaerolineaceae bacterium]|nr:hypothetical protein [Anaerolineaceae bacterium]